MESTLVIKVKYGDALRRFNTFVAENGKLGLNIEKLREKMRSLFNLAVDDDFTLTYTDTDGDSVTLYEECDLDDVLLQRLNPVRMVLTLKTGDKTGSSNARSSRRKSTPMDSSRIHESIENIQASVENLVKTVPEPLRGVLLKLTRDLAATASAPVIADIIHSASKIGESFAWEDSQSFARKDSNVETKDSEGETSSGLPGSKSISAADVKAKEIDSRACRVPDLNHAPPPTSEFAATVASLNTCNNNRKSVTRCPMTSNGVSLNVDVKPFSGSPFSKTRSNLSPYSSYKGDHRSPQFKRIHSHSDSVGPVSHTGVQCDECGVHPITGPRFKSKARHNYDLCSSCYPKSGNEADYVRIDSPMLYHHIMKAVHRKHGGLSQGFQGYGPFKPVGDPCAPSTVKPISPVNQVKLDSRFISDVSVMDGTMMAPSTPFTKIWRMQNNGNVVWPVGTKLVWTDGDKFSNALSVPLEIPATGVPVEGEIDVAIDFVAPELPGDYVSYWRMSSASGQKFGQKIWVAIQVDGSSDALSCSFNHLNLNLNLPPQSNGQNNLVVLDINVEPQMKNTFSPSYLYPAATPVKIGAVSSEAVDLRTTDIPVFIEPIIETVAGKEPMEDKDRNQESQRASSETMGSECNEQELNFCINDFLLVGDAFSNGTAPSAVPSVSYPVVDSSKIEAVAMPVSASPNLESLSPLSESAVFNETRESLLKQLSEMGFSQVDVNREILRQNAYDMEKTVVDLWDISEWDPIMDELEEMGFSDKKKNAILLVKNKGSIRRVVLELVSGDQSQ